MSVSGETRGWMDRLMVALPRGGHLLDLGCGSGEPIARYFHDHGFRLTGVDLSASAIDLAHTRFPKDRWIADDFRTVTLDEQFDGILAWHSLDAVLVDARERMFRRMAGWLLPRGRVLLTGLPGDGERARDEGLIAILHHAEKAGGNDVWIFAKL